MIDKTLINQELKRGDFDRRAIYASSWPPDEFIVPLLKEWIEATIREQMPITGRELRVLDVGCGMQPFRPLIQSLQGHYFGMDVHQTAENTVAFIGAIDDRMPEELAAQGPFDLIICTEVLEHVANWPVAFDNLSKALASGGQIILTCPHSYQLHEEPYDFWRPTNYAIEWHARLVGLVPDRIERLGNAWDVLGGVLANMTPSSKIESRTILNRAIARSIRFLFHTVLFTLLRRRWLHKKLNPNSKLYLANAAILRKP